MSSISPISQPPTIDHGIPMPKGRQWESGDCAILRDLFRGMKPGDSFLWPGNISSAYAIAKKFGWSITTRKLQDGQRRVWRRS